MAHRHGQRDWRQSWWAIGLLSLVTTVIIVLVAILYPVLQLLKWLFKRGEAR